MMSTGWIILLPLPPLFQNGPSMYWIGSFNCLAGISMYELAEPTNVKRVFYLTSTIHKRNGNHIAAHGLQSVLYSGLSKVMTIGQWSDPNTFSLILLSFTLSSILFETRK